MKLNEWAKKWDISFQALLDLHKIFNLSPESTDDYGYSESEIQNLIRIEASRAGSRLWRNNVGATSTESGGFLRYGLANDTPALNRVLKSADLIGIRPILITESHIGKTIGQFMSREVKKSGWAYTGTDREQAQLRWAEFITSFGGDACFATGTGTI